MEQVSSTPSANVYENKPNGSNKITKISFRKIARAAAAELRVHKKIAIISYVLFGVSTLLFMFNAEFYGTSEIHFNPSGWGAVFGGMGIIVGYFAALNIFRDMNNQQLCDVTMALPIKTTERFLSKLLALFYLQIGPLIIATLGGNGVALFFGRINYGPLDPKTTKYLFALLVGGLSISLFIVAIAVLCTCCCGAPAESSYFSIILMFVINALPITFVNYIIGQCSGFTSSAWLFGGYDNGIDVNYWGILPLFEDIDSSSFYLHNLVSILLSLLVLFFSLFIYKKRDARTVGTPVASRVFFEVMMALGCFTVFSFFVMSSAALWGVLIAGVVYIIINIIVSRAKINVLSFLKWIAKYAVTTAAFVVLMVVTIKTGGFGQINARPSAKYLEGAEFSISYYDYAYDENRQITTDKLTNEQANQIIDICQKHLLKGRNELSAVDIMLDSVYYRSTGSVYIRANSDKKYTDLPITQRAFFDKYFVTDDTTGVRFYVYQLRYRRSLEISGAEARVLYAELKALDFVNTPNDDRIYVESYSV